MTRRNPFDSIRMPRDFHGFAEEALRIAGQAGELRRQSKAQSARALSKSHMAEIERTETGATKRLGMKEAGLKERLSMEQAYARPKQRADIGKLAAETAGISYGTGFERGLEDTLTGIMKAEGRQEEAAATEAELGLSEAERSIRLRGEAETAAAVKKEADAATPAAPVQPGRKMRPGLKKFLWEGYNTRFGFLPGIGTPVKGYLDIAELLEKGTKAGYDWAYPRTR